MNLNPATVLDPVFHFLDWIIAEWGVYLFLAFVWLSLILIVVILRQLHSTTKYRHHNQHMKQQRKKSNVA